MITNLDLVKLQIEAWKTVVGVQKHFNDIEMRIRVLLLTLIGILLTAAAGFSEHTGASQSADVAVSAVTSSTMTIVLSVCFVFSFLFLYVDRYWYHLYLRGAVESGESLERLIQEGGVEGVNLTQVISRYSRGTKQNSRRTTGDRVILFYGTIAYLSGGGAILTRVHMPCTWVSLVILGVVLFMVWILNREPASKRPEET